MLIMQKAKHAGLFAFALFVLLLYLLYHTHLFLSFQSSTLRSISLNYKVFKKVWSRFKPIIDAYSGPMKDEYRFWPGLMLVARTTNPFDQLLLVDSFIESHYLPIVHAIDSVSCCILSLGQLHIRWSL